MHNEKNKIKPNKRIKEVGGV